MFEDAHAISLPGLFRRNGFDLLLVATAEPEVLTAEWRGCALALLAIVLCLLYC
jgi:hypothetical protein